RREAVRPTRLPQARSPKPAGARWPGCTVTSPSGIAAAILERSWRDSPHECCGTSASPQTIESANAASRSGGRNYRGGQMGADPDCIFCKIVAGEVPCFKLFEDAETLAFMDINPVHDGHCLVIPKAHCPTIFEIGPEA